MRGTILIAGILFAAPASAETDAVAPARAPEARGVVDDVLGESARLSPAGSVIARGSASPLGGATVAQWTVESRVMLVGGAELARGVPAPVAGARFQVATQETAFVNVVLGGGMRPSVAESSAPQLALRLALSRLQGPMTFALNAVIAQGLGERQDVDVEGTASVLGSLHTAVRVGAEGRYRRELVDRDFPNTGREFEAIAGPTAHVTAGAATFQLLGGVSVPRGFAATGPIAMASVNVLF